MVYQTYKDLEIYKKAHQLIVETDLMSLDLPKYELYEQGSQIRRSSKSIKANIVEGFGRRRYKNEFIKFLTYALASCDKTIDQLKRLFETKSLKNEDTYYHLKREYGILAKMMTNFIKSVNAATFPG